MNFLSLLKDPPPEFVFEIAADGIAMSDARRVALAPGVVAPSPVKENILNPAAFAEVVRKLVPPATGRGRRRAALILPDSCVRIAVLDFDTFPEKEDERLALIGFRLRKSVPFDIDGAALAYFPQAGKKVVVVVTPAEIVAHYEAPFRAAGLNPGLVTVSALAMVDLLPKMGSIVLAHRSPGALTVVAVSDGAITIARSLELSDDTADPGVDVIAEISTDLYPTLAYIEDQTGARPERIFLAGFGADSATAATRLSVELDIPVEPLNAPNPGLAGYRESPRIPVNLAREPFRRDRPMLVGSAVAAVLLVVTLVILISLTVTERRETSDTQQMLARINRQLTSLQKEQVKLDAEMRQPGNEVVLDRSVLINMLIKRKAISWTKIFSDLETVLPPNVRLVAIRPQVNAKDQLFLDMTVAADTPEPVISFIAKLEGSDFFGSTAVSGITPPTQTDTFYRYRLSVNYAQKL